jgi:aminoglycoside 6'-N-acetyltransferase
VAGDPAAELALLTADLDEPLMRQWIVEHRGRPFAYVQAYAPPSWPQAHLMHLPAGAQAIDAFIGEPDMLGRGHGSAFLRVMAEQLIAEGASVIVIDPDRDNHRARHAYARAGFVGEDVLETETGPVVLMLFR